MRVLFRKELQAIIKLLEELKALFIACVHGGSLKARVFQARGLRKKISMSRVARRVSA
jgi:hypothetical protein